MLLTSTITLGIMNEASKKRDEKCFRIKIHLENSQKELQKATQGTLSK